MIVTECNDRVFTLAQRPLNGGGAGSREVWRGGTCDDGTKLLGDRWGRVYLARGNDLSLVGSDGRKRWTVTLGVRAWVASVDVEAVGGDESVLVCGSGVEAGVPHGFILVIQADGKVRWQQRLGREIHACAFDRAANIWLAGRFTDTLEFGRETLRPAGYNTFLAQLSRAGERRWVKQLTVAASASALAVADAGVAVVIGGQWSPKSGLASDSFVAGFADGGAQLWSLDFRAGNGAHLRHLRVRGQQAAVVGTGNGSREASARFGKVSVKAWKSDDGYHSLQILAVLDAVTGEVSSVRSLPPNAHIAAIATTKAWVVIGGSYDQNIDLGAGRLGTDVFRAQCTHRYPHDSTDYEVGISEPCQEGDERQEDTFTHLYVAGFRW